jgi:4'-phosphopantetheinyl transferase
MLDKPVVGAGRDGPGFDHGATGPPAPGEFHTCLVPVRPRSAWLALLDTEETERLAQLTVGEARDTFATSRAVQRLLGARYLNVPPAEVRVNRGCQYCAGNHGRPRWVGGAVEYSISHTGEWLLAAVAGTGPVGVDVESIALNRDVGRLASVTLTEAEKVRFAQLPERMRARWFVRTWTRKEAAMKLVGLGLAAPPGELDVAGRVLSVGRVPRWPDVQIFLHDLPAPPGHAAALASTIEPTAVRAVSLPQVVTLDVVP